MAQCFRGGGVTLKTRLKNFLTLCDNSCIAGCNYKCCFDKDRRWAFTLAEVLITLTILGVIAAISIPAITNNYKERVAISKLKKAYALLENAYNVAVVYNGQVETWVDLANDWGSGANSARNTRYFNYLLKNNIVDKKTCGFADDGCFAINKCKNMKGEILSSSADNNVCTNNTWIWNSVGNWRRILTKDDIAIGIQSPRSNSATDLSINGNSYKGYSTIAVDINGPKEPNTFGKDIFIFVLTDKGVFPQGGPYYQLNGYIWKGLNFSNCHKTSDPSGLGCAYYALRYNTYNYSKLPSKVYKP